MNDAARNNLRNDRLQIRFASAPFVRWLGTATAALTRATLQGAPGTARQVLVHCIPAIGGDRVARGWPT